MHFIFLLLWHTLVKLLTSPRLPNKHFLQNVGELQVEINHLEKKNGRKFTNKIY